MDKRKKAHDVNKHAQIHPLKPEFSDWVFLKQATAYIGLSEKSCKLKF